MEALAAMFDSENGLVFLPELPPPFFVSGDAVGAEGVFKSCEGRGSSCPSGAGRSVAVGPSGMGDDAGGKAVGGKGAGR